MNHRDELIRKCYANFVKSRDFDRYFRQIHRPPYIRSVLAIVLALFLISIPISIGLLISAIRARSRQRKQRQAIIDAAARSVPLMTFPIMVNRRLLSRPGVMTPGLVIGTFEVEPTIPEVTAIVDRMERIENEAVSDETKGIVRSLFADTTYRPSRRRAVPAELTGGKPFVAFDLMIVSDFLPTDTLEFPLIPCVAEPGEGLIQMVPATFVSEMSKTAARADVLRELYERIPRIDQGSYDIAVAGDDKPSRDDLEALHKEIGFELPADFQAFLLTIGGLYVAAKQTLWPRDEAMTTAPYWSLIYGIVVLGTHAQLPPILSARAARDELLAAGQRDLLPFLRRIPEADMYCFNPNGDVIQWSHEDPERRQVVDKSFAQLVLEEFDALADRLRRKQAGDDRRDRKNYQRI